ncbi:hypothetical protein FOMPIDRAFT_1016425 [Fomitopsis schrenkii]|uniref:Uncharacterized protein n=1 Tax=Fomitopsis schrenkii TaxID=2126942 RepID=S8FQL8_FOMSC|nr:hypothetical protein FOMPIDRAFT_1016425 [Fomitopsis schrenkii]
MTSDPPALLDPPSSSRKKEVPKCRCDRAPHAFIACRSTTYEGDSQETPRNVDDEHVPDVPATMTNDPPALLDLSSNDCKRDVPRGRRDQVAHACVERRPAKSECGEGESKSGESGGDSWIKPASLGAETPDARQALFEQVFREATPETGKAEIRQLLGKRPRPDESRSGKRPEERRVQRLTVNWNTERRIGGEIGNERPRSPTRPRKARKIGPETSEIERLDLDHQAPGRDPDPRRFTGERPALVDSAPQPAFAAATPLSLAPPASCTPAPTLFSRIYDNLPRRLPLSWLDDLPLAPADPQSSPIEDSAPNGCGSNTPGGPIQAHQLRLGEYPRPRNSLIRFESQPSFLDDPALSCLDDSTPPYLNDSTASSDGSPRSHIQTSSAEHADEQGVPMPRPDQCRASHPGELEASACQDDHRDPQCTTPVRHSWNQPTGPDVIRAAGSTTPTTLCARTKHDALDTLASLAASATRMPHPAESSNTGTVMFPVQESREESRSPPKRHPGLKPNHENA